MRITASKVGLLFECQYVARDDAEWIATTSAAADRGTRFHRAIASHVGTGTWTHAVAEDIMPLCEVAQAWVDSFGREALAPEVAFAYDVASDTAERVELKGERDYPQDGRLWGTADLVAVSRMTRTGYVGDWKSGDGSKSQAQLRTLALMLSRVEGLESVTVEALEVSAEGVRHVCRETLDAFALDAHAGELAEALASVPDAAPKPGAHCGELYCPARATCPAGRGIIVDSIIPAASLVRHRWEIEIRSPEHAVWLLEHAKLVEAAAKAVKDAVKASCPPEGWQLDDGSVLREGTRTMPRFSKESALSLLRQLGATAEQIEGLTYDATESSGLRVTKPGAKRRAA